MLIRGEDDTFLTENQFARQADALPAATVRVITGRGHLPSFEKPEETTAALAELPRWESVDMTSVVDVMNDDGFQPAQAKDQEGGGTAWRKDLNFDAKRGVAVMIWKADAGYFVSAQPPYAETFVVLSGTAECSIGDAPFAPIGPGAIVHMPLEAGMRLRGCAGRQLRLCVARLILCTAWRSRWASRLGLATGLVTD